MCFSSVLHRDWEACIKLGERVCKPFRSSLPLLGVTPEVVPVLESTFHSLLTSLSIHLKVHLYIMGDLPCIADFAMMVI